MIINLLIVMIVIIFQNINLFIDFLKKKIKLILKKKN